MVHLICRLYGRIFHKTSGCTGFDELLPLSQAKECTLSQPEEHTLFQPKECQQDSLQDEIHNNNFVMILKLILNMIKHF
ncbi:18616_t:CDS:2, partial [Gigaspora rosea]